MELTDAQRQTDLLVQTGKIVAKHETNIQLLTMINVVMLNMLVSEFEVGNPSVRAYMLGFLDETARNVSENQLVMDAVDAIRDILG